MYIECINTYIPFLKSLIFLQIQQTQELCLFISWEIVTEGAHHKRTKVRTPNAQEHSFDCLIVWISCYVKSKNWMKMWKKEGKSIEPIV